jgi:ACS family D-galactonate transporter-like MFS transporter
MTQDASLRQKWTIVALLFGFMLINFADKIALGLAGVPIMHELGLTPQEFGLVGSSFFLFFSISAIPVGYLANRIQSRWLILGMAIIWSLVQFPMLGNVTLALLIACRTVLGAGEGPAYPVALHAAYKWFPNEKRTLPTSIIGQGAAVGVIVAVPLLDWIIERYSWHAAFLALGLAGLVWATLWALFGKEGPVSEASALQGASGIAHVPYIPLIFNRTTLATWLTGFGAFWGQALLLAWFTPYLIQGLKFSQSEAALITTLPWMVSPVFSIGSALLSERLIRRGVSTDVARGLFAGICVMVGGLAMIAVPFAPSAAFKIALIVAGFVLPAVLYVMGHPMVSEYTPVAQRGVMMGLNNAVATSAGIIAPWLMGSVIQGAAAAGGGYERGYLIGGMVCSLAGLVGTLFCRPQTECQRLADMGKADLVPAH